MDRYRHLRFRRDYRRNLKQYDLLFLNNTTGAFLDDPADPTATAARKKALLEFVRSGKGLAGIHAASDSYHEARNAPPAPGGGRGPGTQLATQMVTAGDKNSDKKISRDELSALADSWFDKLDTTGAGKVSQADFTSRFGSVLPAESGSGARRVVDRKARDATRRWAPGPSSTRSSAAFSNTTGLTRS